MKRYSMLWGKDRNGYNTRLGCSEELGKFIRTLNTGEVDLVVRKTLASLQQFERLPGYEKQPGDNLPATWIYAPIYLSKEPNMPRNIKPYSAFCISAAENRNGAQGTEEARDSRFGHVFFISRESMLTEDEGRNYFDQLFGGRFTSWRDVQQQREGTRFIDFDERPEHLNPDAISPSDIALGAAIAAEMFGAGDHAVVVRLERGQAFNNRAREILKAVYSLLPTLLAVEVGFAAYLAPEKIDEFRRKMSIKLFLIPAECGLMGLSDEVQVFDLADGNKYKPNTQIGKRLHSMAQDLDWENRLALYKELCPEGNSRSYQADNFIEKTDQFLREKEKFEQVCKDELLFTQGTSLEKFNAELQQFPLLQNLPGFKTAIRKMGQAFGRKDLREKTANEAVEAVFSVSSDEAEQHKKLFNLGRELLNEDISLIVARISKARAEEENNQVIANERINHNNELKAMEAALRQEKAQLELEKNQEIENERSKHNRELNDLETAFRERLKSEMERLESERKIEQDELTRIQQSKYEDLCRKYERLEDENKRLKKLRKPFRQPSEEETEPLTRKASRRKKQSPNKIWLLGLVAFMVVAFVVIAVCVHRSKPEPIQVPVVTAVAEEVPELATPVLTPDPTPAPTPTPTPAPAFYDTLDGEETQSRIIENIPLVQEIRTGTDCDSIELPGEFTEDGYSLLAVFSIKQVDETSGEEQSLTEQSQTEESESTWDSESESTWDSESESTLDDEDEDFSEDEVSLIYLLCCENQACVSYRYIVQDVNGIDAVKSLNAMAEENDGNSAELFYSYQNKKLQLGSDLLADAEAIVDGENAYVPEGAEYLFSIRYADGRIKDIYYDNVQSEYDYETSWEDEDDSYDGGQLQMRFRENAALTQENRPEAY